MTYLRERNPTVARRVGQSIFTKLDHIAQFPQAQRAIIGLPSFYREAFVENYRLLYRVVGDTKIRFLSIRHTRQRPLTPQDILEME